MRPRLFHVLLLLTLLNPVPGDAADSASGTYLATDEGASIMLQLVQTPDGKLSGVCNFSKVNPTTGKVENTSTSVSGSSDGRNLILSIRPVALLAIGTDFAGTLERDRLTLVTQGHDPLVLRRSTLDEYAATTERLRKKSIEVAAVYARKQQEEREGKAIKEQAASVDRVRVRAISLEARIDRAVGDYPATEVRYRSITTKMQGFLDKMEPLSTVDPSRTSSARYRLDQAIREGDSTRQAVHDKVHAEAKEMRAGLAKIEADLSKAERACELPRDTAVALREPDAERALSAACKALPDDIAKIRAKAQRLDAGLAKLDAVHAAEKPKQAAIVKRSAEIERL